MEGIMGAAGFLEVFHNLHGEELLENQRKWYSLGMDNWVLTLLYSIRGGGGFALPPLRAEKREPDHCENFLKRNVETVVCSSGMNGILWV